MQDHPFKNTIALIGGSGFLGTEFIRASHYIDDVDFISITRNNYNYWSNMTAAKPDWKFFKTIWVAGISSKLFCNENPEYCWDQNVDAVLRAIDDFPCEQFVYVSSLDVYPKSLKPELRTEDICIDKSRLSSYGRCKYGGEEVVKEWADRWLILRCNGFVGPGLKKNIVYDLNQNIPKVWVHPSSTFQFIHTDIFVDVVGILSRKYTNQVINVGPENPISVSEVAGILNIDHLQLKTNFGI